MNLRKIQTDRHRWTSHLNLLSVAFPLANTLTLAAWGDSYKQKSNLKHLFYILINEIAYIWHAYIWHANNTSSHSEIFSNQFPQKGSFCNLAYHIHRFSTMLFKVSIIFTLDCLSVYDSDGMCQKGNLLQ